MLVSARRASRDGETERAHPYWTQRLQSSPSDSVGTHATLSALQDGTTRARSSARWRRQEPGTSGRTCTRGMLWREGDRDGSSSAAGGSAGTRQPRQAGRTEIAASSSRPGHPPRALARRATCAWKSWRATWQRSWSLAALRDCCEVGQATPSWRVSLRRRTNVEPSARSSSDDAEGRQLSRGSSGRALSRREGGVSVPRAISRVVARLLLRRSVQGRGARADELARPGSLTPLLLNRSSTRR